MRRAIAVVLPLTLAGCGLPPAVTILSYALDGFSLFSTGKTIADHALSVASKRDCAVWRVVKSENVCHEFKEGEKSILVAAAEEWERGSEIVGQTEPEALPAGTVATATAFDPVVVPSFMDGLITGVDGIMQVEDPIEVPPMAFALPMNGPVGLAARPMASTRKSPQRASTRSWTRPADPPKTVAPAEAGRRMAVVRPDRRIPPQARGRARAPAPRTADKALVIGSFSQRANAVLVAVKWRDLEPEIVRAKVRGKVVYRVVTGVSGRAQFASRLRRLKSGGVTDAWTVPVCGAAQSWPAASCIQLRIKAVI